MTVDVSDMRCAMYNVQCAMCHVQSGVVQRKNKCEGAAKVAASFQGWLCVCLFD